MQFPPVPSHLRPDWVRRFATRAMHVQPALDALSAFLIADGQFDDAGDLEPEQAAEIFIAPN